MNGKKIEISLYHPIIIDVRDPEKDDKTKTEAVHKVRGLVTAFSDAGIQIEIADLEDIRGNKVPAPHRVLFIPHHKIDHCFLL